MSSLVELDALFGMLDVDLPDKLPEDKFLAEMLAGINPRIQNLYSWLTHEMAHFSHLKASGIALTRSALHNGVRANVELTQPQYAACMIEYYLYMYHLPRFTYMGLDGLTKEKIADIQKTVALICELDATKKIIWKKFE